MRVDGRRGRTGNQNPAVMLSVREGAELLGIAPPTMRLWISQGRIAHYRLGRRVVLKESDLLAFLEASRVPARPSAVSVGG